HRPRRKHLSERDRRCPARQRRLWRRVPRHHLAAGGDGRAVDPRRDLRRARAAARADRADPARAAAGAAGSAAAAGAGGGRIAPAHRVQGAPGDRRPRPLPEGNVMISDWEAKELAQFLEKQPESKARYETLSGIPVKRVYTDEDAV